MPSFSSYQKQKPIKMGTSFTDITDSAFRHKKRTTDRNPMTLAISDLARLNKECLIMILTDLYNDAKIAIYQPSFKVTAKFAVPLHHATIEPSQSRGP